MTPRPRGAIPAQNIKAIKAALAARFNAQQRLEQAIAEALQAGGSVREVALISGLSTTTVQKYNKGER